ncbi:MATE family efflux transporter [Carnobacteriaceae bacterium zg-84]|uniref:MATE family efflux transporter n=1 Tax=Granulicatella sp. zg-84 TaxID=2678503 RepID=UPI0013BF7F46|nr:MATE family efflux transporter [Granulicatella sp. zg-84]NEW66390.1 MATE family efflux transporter [Granulicatella sp. zg-84]QMI86144.1 MATE family efflux transporter [Carnobacteriaceae bacterium zg-84]
MTTKEFYREYIKIVIPLMFQGLVTTLVAMVDNLMVGQLGDLAIAAVAMSNRILGIVLFTLFGIAAASSVFIAQFYGARDKEMQKEAFRTSLILSSGLVFVSFLVLLLIPETVVHFFVQDIEIERLAVAYIRIMILGFVPYLLTINYGTALKVVGQVRLPLVASLSGVVLNTCLNYVLIFGNFGFSAMGVEGAAIATVFARLLEFGIIYYVVYTTGFDFNTKFKDIFKVDRALFKDVCYKAVPLAVNEIIWAFGQATILKLYGVRGSNVIAALSISDTTTSIFYSITQGISAATPVLVSQRLGAGKLDEAYQNGKMLLKTIGFVAACLGLIMFGMSHIVPNLYQVSKASHDLAVQMIQLTGMFFWIYLTGAQNYFIMRAGGDMKSTLLMDGGFKWGVTIPVMAILAYFTQFSAIAIFMCTQVCEFIQMCVGLRFFFKKRWLKNLTVKGNR